MAFRKHRIPKWVLATMRPKRWNTETTDPCPDCKAAGLPYTADCMRCNFYNRIAELTIARIFHVHQPTA